MIPPVLEIYVVWHPGDVAGQEVATQIFDHFHGSGFSGLIGGAVEVYTRFQGWRSDAGAPRPVPFPGVPQCNFVREAQIVAVVPVLGNSFANAVETGEGEWFDFSQSIAIAQNGNPSRVGVFPILLDAGALDGTVLGQVFGRYQRIAAGGWLSEEEPAEEVRCRDLAQGITQTILGPDARLTIFISHTKKYSGDEEREDASSFIRLVRSIVQETRLQQFFDASDLQPGRDWDRELRRRAGESALLALRTDLYASREWCQREMLIAKRAGMPIVILDAPVLGEERGSFLMDHVPRVPVRLEVDCRKSDIRRGLNLLVDECLKRSLWDVQKALAAGRTELGISWWAPHAPEPITLAQWLTESISNGSITVGSASLRILHPDPPLGFEEQSVLAQIAALAGQSGEVDVLTPRLLAARGV